MEPFLASCRRPFLFLFLFFYEIPSNDNAEAYNQCHTNIKVIFSMPLPHYFCYLSSSCDSHWSQDREMLVLEATCSLQTLYSTALVTSPHSLTQATLSCAGTPMPSSPSSRRFEHLGLQRVYHLLHGGSPKATGPGQPPAPLATSTKDHGWGAGSI